MRILLTGGSGFIGRNLAEALRPRHDMFVPSHTELDVTDTATVDAAFRERRFDAVIHAAVQGGDRVLETTLRGYWNLARHADEVDRLIYFGSGAEYGKQRDLVKVRETEIGRFVPGDPYGLAKLICNEDARRHKRVLNLRLFGVYGPHEGYLFRFISNSIVKSLLGLPIVVNQDVVFDYLYVSDLTAIVERLLELPEDASDLNCTPTESISLRRILDVVSAAAPRPPEITFRHEGLNREYTGNNGRLLEVLGGFRFVPYDAGIRRLHEFYTGQIENLDRSAVARDDYLARTRHRGSEEQQEVRSL